MGFDINWKNPGINERNVNLYFFWLLNLQEQKSNTNNIFIFILRILKIFKVILKILHKKQSNLIISIVL